MTEIGELQKLEKLDDRQIANGLRLGDPEAFRVLYRALGSAVLAYLVRVTGRREMAEELTQETFLTVIRKIGFFTPREGGSNGADGGLRAWVFRIATNLALDVLRREKRISPSELADVAVDGEQSEVSALFSTAPGRTPQEELERRQLDRLLDRAIDALSPAQRAIFLLREQQGLSALEISRSCGCSENAVKQSLFRSRATLRKAMEGALS